MNEVATQARIVPSFKNGKAKSTPGDSMTEGIGLGRIDVQKEFSWHSGFIDSDGQSDPDDFA